MNRNFSIILILLATFSIVNSIPLHKRAVNFEPCPIKPAVNPLTVTMDPPEPVAGGTAKFTITGKLSQPVEKGSGLGIGFYGEDKKQIGEPFLLDICSLTTCPLDEIYVTVENFKIPKNLPEKYAIIVVAVASDKKTPLGCAAAGVGPDDY